MMQTLRKHSSILAKMKIFLPLVVWIILLFRTTNAQLSASRKHVGIFGLKHEVFFLNLEDGYFGCQVNESTDYLQLYELSKLCDGTSDCYMGSDELRNKLKCTNDCDKDGTACSNGVCLDGQCHCNDGFGGCNCQVPDENECKYRPCDVFAHCTNTLGSFTCTCFPGYQGDGLHCEDIDECQDPNIAQRCVENAECCNLPAHFVCKCKPGFEGDGEERCADINECLDPQACGLNAECVNLPGNYTCQCREGYYGDPYNGCVDVDECVQPGVCGPGAICTNLEGGYRCDCPQGFDGDARSAQGCLDYDECARSPCGRNALCRNEVGSFRCECQQGFSGDPMTDCQAACSETDECNQDEVCSNGQCVNPCHEVNACGMNAECLMGAHAKQCSCPAGFTGDAAVECVRVPISCASNTDCTDGSICKESMCLPRCKNDQECALNEKCLQGSCMLTCRLDNDCFLGHICLAGRCVYGCHADSDCSASETCRDNRCVNPCQENPCGPNAACTVVNHRASCSCFSGMVPSPTAKVGCVRAPALQCTENRDCADGTSCIDRLCRPVCANDQSCLNNERCDGGSCKPICRKDDDCRTGEICQGQTCMIGCRSDGGCADHLTCSGQQCVDPCQEPTACGTNAECVVVGHRKQCSCPAGLVGDPFSLGCRQETRLCQARTDCPKGQACYGGTCMQTCRNDQNCLADERCVRGTCRTVCNSDAACGDGLICEGRICQAGCRSDNQCSNTQACINKKCTDPCATLGQCGSCSECKVIDHGVQCSCPQGYLGNPLLSCSPPAEKCNAQCTCDEDGMYCVKACRQQKDCGCGQTCHRGKCRSKCNPGNCPAGLLCQNGACVAGCRTNADCPSERSCTNGKCVDPCAGGRACGKNALCQVSDHRSLCLCPDGFQGDPSVGCVQYECQTNDDCELDKKCASGKCINPCLSPGACGLNAQCRVVNRQAQCSCTPGFFGNARHECQPVQKNGCAQNPCGENTVCREDENGYECSCQPGCVGDPRQGCLCEEKLKKDDCEQYACGTNAVCRMTEWGAPSCVCLPTHPHGDPYMSCTQDDTATDCRTTGCAEGECVRDGAKFICRKDESCANDLQCANDKACIGGKCSDPCSLRGACGDNALCQTVLHRPRCSCPNCYIGRPNVECKPDPKCEEVTTPRPNDPKIVSVACETNGDCHESLRCDASRQCSDPCTVPAPFVCDSNKKCVSRRHRPSCVCAHGFIVNDSGELVCAPEKRECFGDDGCASNMACLDGRCVNPCFANGRRSAPCPDDKACVVVDHRPTCVCMKDCSPSLSICLRDSGCPDELACRNYQCVNPCETTTCAEDTPCYVEDHKPICKFCPPGFVKDVRHGCLKELGCRHSNECPLERSCINGICVDPCRSGNPCDIGEECEVQNHETVCVKLCQCEKASDCAGGLICDGCNCVQKDTDRTTGCEHCPPGIPCDPITGGCVKEPPGSPKTPEPCQSDNDCLNNEACYMGLCENPCLFDGVCAETATCQAKMHRPICTCPPGHEGNPTIKCTVLESIQCTTNDECSLTEACVGNMCQRPCDVKNTCTANAVCINTNHGTDCSCIDGYHGNGFVQCVPVTTVGSVCQYNEDCPPDKLCDRLNRICINPCQADSCGDNAECFAVNHGIDCRCRAGYVGNAYIECTQHQGCLSDRQCNDNEACIQGRCSSPCQCGPNAMCDVKRHKAVCRCPPGYGGNARTGCNPPSNPCEPNPCGINAMCEIDNGSPVCFCPRGLTGNPFKNCIPEGNECTPNPCGPNSGCRKINGKPTCFCLPEFEGNPPQTPCTLPQNPCVPSPCGPNTQCTILSNGYAKCTCVPGYIESPNTIRGCVEPSSPCDPNPCGFGAICDATRNPVCYCPDSMIGNPYRSCLEPVMTPELCQPGPCGANADCYVAEGREQCYCKPNFIGDPYGGCVEQPRSVCEPNPCGPGAECVLLVDGAPGCRCPPGLSGDPTTTGCHAFECLSDDQCAADKACIGLRCADPCPGSCGAGAHCRVEKHHPVCFCDAGLTGNPAVQCYSLDERPRDACNPSPCGANARCSVRNKRPVCKCLTNYHGDPRKGCKPECDINSDCTPDKSCVNHKCVSPCALGTVCGVNAECSVNYHTPMCKCPSGYTGDAFVQCVPIPEDRNMTRQPCSSDPCGPGEVCSIYGNDVALCDPCVAPDAIHNPRCRPQCVLNTDCPFNMACLQSECRDPCPGSCGYNALCTVERHRPVCYCPPEMYGNPYEQCKPQESPRETCASIRCGANTQCKQQNGVLACVCKKNYYGDPLIGCRPECVVNTDCPISKACVNSRCVDPCVDACGVSAQCKVVNHLPICFCPPTHTGDALVACTERTYLPPDNTPCDPNPCGPNSKCRTTPDGYAICSCLPGYRGVPPACQAECMINAECPQNKACINLKCADPCPGTCGVGARCEVLNHNPICSCGANQQGDPFVICEARQNEPPVEQKNPCDPSPCGPNSICQVRGRRPVCSCQPNFIGSPPACRPECVLSSECPQDKACINEKCQNPCANACGANADCHIVAHSAFCSCRAGFEGDAFIGCSAVPKDTPKDVCYPNPCAENAVCSEHNGAAKCTCITPYLGDPYNTGCRPECVLNSDCPSHTACVNQHCRDPCPGVCGTNADCTVANHIPVCECSRGYVGDPFRGCRREVPPLVAPKDPCASCPSNSVCRVVGGRPTCSCPEGYRGTPPACRPECSSSEECPHDRSCINLKCADPCPGLCGINAQCQVINHKPFCSCQRDMIGNPFEQCYPKPAEPVHPCQPSPCGAYSECREIDNRAVCTCAAGMLGTPPNCRPECETDQDCPSNRACFNQKCRDPCVGSCGYNAQCSTRNHRPECYCIDGFEGDPYSGCNPVAIKRDEIIDPCNPSPCGSNAICKDRNGAGSCKCMPNYFGDPYVNCRPECVQSSECPSTKACVNMRCIDPCLGTCGLNSECRVHNHSPYCSCSPGYTGNPSQACRPIVVENLPARHPIDPCSPSPCGPYSICRVLDGHPVCSCQISCSGVPPNCRPECLINAECPRDRTCINHRCIDPCPGTCGMNARCRVVNHNPICSCNAGFIGDPFVQCSPEPTQPILEEEYRNPCQPSPCGVNSVCKVHNNRAVCSCLPNYVGRPPSCRPECAVDSECPMNLACINEKCRNPCLGSCGVNTECAVVAHKPLCSCTAGYSGDPFAGCSIIPIVQQETPMPCNPSPCGANAICKERNGAGSCTCAPEYFGDPYVGCRPECVMNSDCPRTRACINNKCQDPCPGTCGVNAECHVVNHAPSCVCLTGFIGNPFTECRPQPEIRDEPVVQPCQPSPCGPNSVCRVLNNHAVCTCKQNYIGSPPNCRPECVVSSECPLDKSCVKTKCVDPCPGTCGFNARCQVVNHNPICSCKAGFTGDPFVRCIPEERRPIVQETPTDPCIPSPCGPNSQCKAVGHTAACSCLPNYIGRAPNCRPECTSNSQCTPMKACINERCGDPCPGSCGSNALCSVQNHQPNCRCIEGYEGDPYTSCNPVIIHREPEIVDPCNPSPCGINAECNVRNNAGSCTCVKDYYGDPYHECRPECMLSSDCPNTRACLNNKCVDPCPGMCGLNAECFVMNHSPSCSCLPGYTGNPSQACREIPKQIEHTPIDPCRPSPCGPYSQCRNVNEHAVCSCQANYIGSPPACRPECTVSSECAMDKACIKQSCLDPCPGTCGFNARCTVINHNPICSCPSGFTGDPFERCVPEEKQVVQAEPTNPCLPSPCGPNSQCRAVGNVPACSCLPNYVGRAPNCRPECTINAECSGNLACVNEKCADPCPGSCGPNAVCRVIEHSPSCSCQTGYTGDPFSGCTVIPLTPVREESRNPCNPSPCGSNAVCKERNGAGSCTCLPDYFGDPYSGCRPECVTNSDCPRVRACVNNKCADPCPGVCGIDAECYVVNHSPSCACRPGYTGDPFTQCRPPEQPKQNEPINPCTPSPCGPNSICRESNGHAVCTCQASFIGTPPNCRPECIVSSECALDKACIGQKCNDPCPGTCGQNARCQVVNHNPICSCSLGFTGDPFVRCVPVEKDPVVQDPVDPCVPSPCGPNSVCRAIGSTPACSCLPNYIGRAPNCRPECMLNAECPATLACVNERCTNPCVGSCGINARCTVVKHNPICECEAGFTGDPFSVCTEIVPIRDVEPVNPCNPSPCGANAVCKERNGAGSCTCMPEYFGDPYTGCRPECVQNTDCEKSKACMNNKCRDPCPGVCGLNAECVVQNHSPVCFCLEGYTGDPASTCTLAEIVTERPKTPGCQPSPCGPNSQCREINGHPVCSCLAGYIGTPPMCRPECVVSSECSQDRACVNKKCVDPCPGTCGAEARCQVVNHNPICSCPPGFTGDPFVQCAKKEEQKDITPVNPCVPSPCGPNSNCRTVGSQPACSCAANYIGRPPNCRPECTRDAECPSNLACQNEKCVDPCAAGCGLNAVCRVINHKPVCTCDEGFEGNPLEQCSRILPPTTERLTPCTPSPCGPNAECRERNNAGACYCLTGYEGNPYDVFSGCRRECDVNADCPDKLACVQYKCVDPCPGVCGAQALCEIQNHVPTCICPEGTVGDPFVQCNLRMADPVTPAAPVCDKYTCGPNSICRIQNGVAVCKCQPDMVGSPPNCRPECQQNSDCEANRACVNLKCIDPCPGSCGQNANCNIINHNPICSCAPGFTGDPFTRCYKEIVTTSTTEAPRALCTPSPCGPNAECKVIGDREACSCLPGYIGAPPSCRPECILSTECADNQACIRQKCEDPCPGSCGLNAKCSVSRHTPSCSCDAGFTGDPFTGCQAIIVTTPPPQAEPRDPCYPSPCGVNARCRPANGETAICECIENYFGNPYESCRPECVANGDCQKSLACINNRCKDPCPGVCGKNAECAVVNHTPVCSCPDGMKGNAFEQCLREEVTPPPSDPCYPSPCGQNTVCRVFNGNAVCECLPEFKGSPFGRGCYPECVINSDCPRDRTCVNKKCVDPCPGVCGYRAECHAINNSPVCSCPRDMIGDPFVECKVAPPKDPCNPSPCRTNGICRVVADRAECQYPECIINSDCSTNRACYNQRCQDPCVGACGINALCSVINHSPVCSCPARHAGSPFVQCVPQRDEPQQPQPECTSDGQCTNDKACIGGQCQNPCTVSTGLCTQNAECRVQFHRAICACREGYTGNAQLACYEIGCRSDSDCPATEACVNKNCIDPCRHTQCGRNAYCKSDYNHNARCHCMDGYRGNPLVGCTRPECTSNDECPYHQSCQNEQCRDPCNCAPNAQCRVDNHQANCRCPPGYTGDPLFSCEKIPVRDPAQCTMDADCPSKLACFEGVCKNPCTETKPCAEHAVCTVQDTLPLRTMYCVCEEGYAGDAERQCLPVSKDEPGCYSDVECAPTESCRARVCVDVCSDYNPCASSAECLAQSHKAICSCPVGTVGDPFQNCYKPPVVSPECVVDADCSSSMACVNERCQDPCAGSNPCGGNAECRAVYHRPHCTCPIGWGGDPKTQCYKPECKIDAECPFDKACFNEKCISPCTYGATQCGRGADCVAQSHRAVCICPPGTQGNPFVSCVTGMCQYNEDCAEHEACDRLNRVCRPVCDDETCARTATCVARNHQASCECAPGMRGNPYVECMRDVPEPECRMDSECGSQQACIRNRCVNPCTELTPCASQQKCSVIDTLPLRTIICACQTDMLMDRSGSCKPIVIEECRLDSDCADTDRCLRGQCVEACKADPCGINAQCASANHRAQCTCSPGYVGNAHIECLPEPRVTSPKECAADDDCSDDRACFNDRCVNPCVSDACGRGALCRTSNHKAVCNCPSGYTMDGNGNCIPPAGDLPRCRSNSDCTRSETCVNEICANPCNCGQNADCFVKDHYPVCSCRPGYSGNAQTGCFKLECQADSDCTNDKQCTNGACVDPCLYQNPCALNAECYGDRHRAACRCLPGLEGNPFERCRRVECHYDGECAKTLACQQEQCVDPCANSPCAQNAQCFVSNHQAQCKCPEQMPEGNPYSFCRPRAVEREECRVDGDCPSRMACIGNRCLNPCNELRPCAASALCTVQDSVPVRTMVCECPPLHVPDSAGECRRIVLQTPVGVCTTDSECSEQEACINRQCRDPCSCGSNAICTIKNHRAVCSCEDGYEGNPNVACRAIGCRVDSECETSKACVNGNCVNPCLDHNPCGIGAECFGRANRAECRCLSGYRGNPLVQCNVVECRSNNDCPDDKQCRNAQCVNPCIYENSCSPRAECRAQNHLVVCRCPVGLVGNPYVDCRPEVVPECQYDTDCPGHLACIDNKCMEPCSALTPCNQPARCEVVPSSPVRTMLCTCPDGYVSSGSGTCKPVVKAGCISDSDCSSDTACINSICRDPCNCGPNAECRVKDHKPVCSCAQGYDGDPETQCIKIECRSDSDCSGQHTCYNRQCVPACSMESCGTQAECIGVNHRAVCECVPGYEGNPKVACKLIGCRRDSDCPLDKACINGQCGNPCELQAVCAQNEQCQVYQHRPECACPPPFENDPLQGCVLRDDRCMTDGECPSQTACIQGECVNPCNVTEPCGVNSNCKVLDTLPVRTMICECLPGYQGNAAIQCDKMALCPTDRGFVRNSNGECVCPPGYGLSLYDDCQPCREEDGLKVDETGRCVCALERGLIIDERGRCICPIEYGYRLTSRGECVRSEKPECERDEHCADWRYCNLESKTCDDPCQRKICGTNALCNATNHQAVCQCITGYTGNPEEHCNQTTNFRTDFPQPEMVVTCQADGVQVVIDLAESNFNGVLYVKGHSKDEECRRVVNLAGDTSSARTQIFKVHFGSCGLIHVNGIASFVLVIQKHPKLVTYKAQAYHIKCVYQTGEQNVTLGFNVQMLTTAGTIANTGPPPTCAMRIVAFNGEEINSAEIGDNLRLQVEVQPATIYGGFARSCVAKTMEESVENEYIVTDEDGCATDPSIFGDWEYNAETNSLLASFNAFKFPSSDNIRFQCNIRVCFGKCQPVNCHGANAYGKRRRRREALGIDMMSTIEVVYNRTKRAADDTALATDDSLGMEGTLREEITIQSNAILTLEKREERSYDSNNITPAAQRVEDICVSMIGLILALVITALLALVAVAVAVSCWLMAYRRRPTITGPLPHPPEFPNPLFAHHEPSEPSHHDFMG